MSLAQAEAYARNELHHFPDAKSEVYHLSDAEMLCGAMDWPEMSPSMEAVLCKAV